MFYARTIFAHPSSFLSLVLLRVYLLLSNRDNSPIGLLNIYAAVP